LGFASFRVRRPLRILGLLTAAVAEPAAAQDEYEQAPDLHTLEDLPASGIPVDVRVRSDTRFVLGSDFGSSDANLYWPRGSVRVGVPLSKRAAVRFRVNGGAAIYDFDGTTNLFGQGPSPGEPFDDLYSGSFAFEGMYRMSNTWALISQGFVTARWEGGAAFGDSISGGGGLALGYRIPNRLELILGVGLASTLDRSGPRPYPLIDLEWQITEKWRFRTHGEGASVEYEVDPAFHIFLRGHVESSRYRLDSRPGPGNQPGSASRGTVRDRQILVGLGFRWRVHPNVRIGAAAGVMAYDQIKVRDKSGNNIQSITADPAPYIELRIDFLP